MSGRLMAIALLVFLGGYGAGAAAQEGSEAEARALFAKGQQAFELSHFDEAAQAFEAAYKASRRPALLWNLAQAYRRQFDMDHDLAGLRRARSTFHNYCELVGTPQEQADGRKGELEADEAIKAAEKAAEKAREKPAAPSEKPATPTEKPAATAAAAAPIAATPATTAKDAPAHRPVVKSPWLWVGVGAAAVVVVGAVLVISWIPSDAVDPVAADHTYSAEGFFQ